MSRYLFRRDFDGFPKKLCKDNFATVIEANKLAEEMAAFSAVPHTNEEWDAFRKLWRTKIEKFAEEMAQGDPLAVEVIVKAIEKESKRGGVE